MGPAVGVVAEPTVEAPGPWAFRSRSTRKPATCRRSAASPRRQGDRRRPTSLSDLARRRDLRWSDGASQSRSYRDARQPALPRRDDVRRLGRARPRRVDRDHPPGARRRDQLHRHRRHLLAGRVGDHRRQGAARAAARRRHPGHQVPRPDGRADGPARAATRTSGATPGAGSSRRSRTACAGCRPTGSTSTRCTAPTPAPTTRRPSPRSPTCSGRARSAPSAPRRSRRTEIVEAQWIAERRGWAGSSPSSRRTRSSSAASRRDVLPVAERYGLGVLPWSPLAGGWLTGRYRKGQDTPQSQPGAADARPVRPVHARRTRPSSTRPTRSPCSPRSPACRWSTWRSRSSCSTRRSRRRSSGRARMEQLESPARGGRRAR